MPTPPRRFTVTDAMILVAATAGWLMFFKEFVGETSEQFSSDGPITRLTLSGCAMLAAISAAPIVSVGSVTLLALKLRKPRPRLRRLVRQPGVVACGAVTMVLLFRAAGLALDLAVFEPSDVLIGISFGASRSIDHTPVYATTASSFIYLGSPGLQTFGWNVELGTAVASAWLLLAVSGRWRAEPGWLDRLGRILGAYWVGMLALEWLSLYLVQI